MSSEKAIQTQAGFLLQAEAFGHESLQARLVEEVVGKFFVGEHGESRAFGPGGKF